MSTSAVTQQEAVPRSVLSQFHEDYIIPTGYAPFVGAIPGVGHVTVGVGKVAVNCLDLTISGIGSVVPHKSLRGKCQARLSEGVSGLSRAVKMIGRGVLEIIPGAGLGLRELDKRCDLERRLAGLLKNLETSANELIASQKSVLEAQTQLSSKTDMIRELESQKQGVELNKETLEAQKKELEAGRVTLEADLKVQQDLVKAKEQEIAGARANIRKLTVENETLQKQIPVKRK